MSQAYRDRCAEKGIDGDALGIDGRSNSGTNGAGTTMLGGGGGYNEEPCWRCCKEGAAMQVCAEGAEVPAQAVPLQPRSDRERQRRW